MKLKKVICWFKGHAAYPEIKCEAVPTPSINSMNLLGGFTIPNSLNPNMINMGTVVSDNTIKYSSTPFQTKFGICYRCQDVFWTTSINKESLCNSSVVPELDEAAKIKRRALWEEQQRKKNETAAILYKQYLVALKLGYNDDDTSI